MLILKRGTRPTTPLAAFSWERRRLACSGSGQDGRAPRGLGDGHDLRRRLFSHQMAKMSIAAVPYRGLSFCCLLRYIEPVSSLS